MDTSKTFIIGIVGGTGSGKTTVANAIIKKIGSTNISYVCHDYYYKDLAKLSQSDKEKVNFDHPNSLDTELMISDVHKLYNKNLVHAPIYDYSTHSRKPNETKLIIPQPIILVEGILLFNSPDFRKMCDLKIFVDTEADERFIRRLKRDIQSRGRTVESIIEQYKNTVKPMHQQFVEPTKAYADIIIPSGYNKVAVDILVSSLETILTQKKNKQ